MKKCPYCLATKIVKLKSIDAWWCESCSIQWATCGNCDVAESFGRDSDDCSVCGGTSFVPLCDCDAATRGRHTNACGQMRHEARSA